jgi:hypothetical protein
MKRAIWMLGVVLGLVGLVSLSYSASITWSNGSVPPGHYLDSEGSPLGGSFDDFPPAAPDLSLGALVQLWQAVGDIDDPRNNMEAYQSTDWKMDDILLDESHIGFGTFADLETVFADQGDYPVLANQTLYVRAYNVPKPEFASTAVMDREIGIRNDLDVIVTNVSGDPKNPQTMFFNDLRTEPIPEPTTLLLLAPGLAIWALRRKK